MKKIYIMSPYESFLMALSQERKCLQQAFFNWLCKEHPQDVIIRGWKGRPEEKLDGTGKHFSYFFGRFEFDVARAYRTSDKINSPILIGYEIKGTTKIKKRLKADSEKVDKYLPPPIHEGGGQADWMLRQDADYVYVVRPPLQDKEDNEELIRQYQEKPHHGLIFVDEINGRLRFSEAVSIEGKKPNLKINSDRKKQNIASACMFRKGHGQIQKQDWARKAEFVEPLKT